MKVMTVEESCYIIEIVYGNEEKLLNMTSKGNITMAL